MPFPELAKFLPVPQMRQQPGSLGSRAREFSQDSGQGIHPQALPGDGFVDRPPHHNGGVDAEGWLETMVCGPGTAGSTHGLDIADSRGCARCWWVRWFRDSRERRDWSRRRRRLWADPAQEGGEQIPETFRGDADPEPSAQPAPFQGLDPPKVVESMVYVLGVPGVGEPDDHLHVVVEHLVVCSAEQVGRQPRMGREALPEDRGRELRGAAPVGGAERLAEVLVRGNVSRHEAQGTGQ